MYCAINIKKNQNVVMEVIFFCASIKLFYIKYFFKNSLFYKLKIWYVEFLKN